MAVPQFDWFDEHNPDSILYEDLIRESIGYYGIDAYYMIRTSLSNVDSLMGDDPTKAFHDAWPVKMYIQTVDQFEGFELISKFGMEVRKSARFLVATKDFTTALGTNFGRPREGDILWLRNFKAFFEIKKADEEHIFYTFGQSDIYGYSLVAEKWNYDQAEVHTGIEALDKEIDRVVIAYEYFLSNANTGNDGGTYQGHEEVMGLVSGATGRIVRWNYPSLTLTLKDIQGVFLPNDTVIGLTSQTQYTLVSSNTRVSVNDQLADNQTLANISDPIIIWTSDNPFGEPEM